MYYMNIAVNDQVVHFVFCFKPRDFSTERITKLVRGWYSVEYRNDSSILNHLKSKKVNKNIEKNVRFLTNSSKGLAKIKLRHTYLSMSDL